MRSLLLFVHNDSLSSNVVCLLPFQWKAVLFHVPRQQKPLLSHAAQVGVYYGHSGTIQFLNSWFLSNCYLHTNERSVAALVAIAFIYVNRVIGKSELFN